MSNLFWKEKFFKPSKRLEEFQWNSSSRLEGMKKFSVSISYFHQISSSFWMMSAYFQFHHTLDRLFSNYIKLYWNYISPSWNMRKGRGGGGNWPHPGETALKKTSLIRVKVICGINFSISPIYKCSFFQDPARISC